MRGPAAVSVELSDEEREELESWTRQKSSSPRQFLRAKVVLLAAEGMSNTEISEKLDYSRFCVADWRARFANEGLDGLRDRPRSGRPRLFSP